jgi:hypothetical protein
VYYLFLVSYSSWLIYTANDTLNANVNILNTTHKFKEYILSLKVVKFLILIPPPPPLPPFSVFQKLVSESVPSGNNLTIGREIMEYMMFGVP